MTAGPPPREAWQAASAGQSTKPQRIGMAICLLLLAAIAVVAFIFTMRGPSVSSPFVQSMYVPDYDQLVAHSPYVPQDIQRIRDLFVETGTVNDAYIESKITSGALLTDQRLQSERLKNFAACQSDDIAIFYIAANGIVDEGGRAGLLSSDGSVSPLEELMLQIQSIEAETKLVFLDSGQVGEEYLNGNLINEFPIALHQIMSAKSGDEKSFDSSLWVINSHGLFQSSRLSHTRRGSVFGVAVSDALSEFCQNADPNEPIQLGPLYQSICRRCASMTMEGDRPAQMPLLLRGGHGVVFYSDLETRDQAMAQDVIYPRQMIRPPSLDEEVEAKEAKSEASASVAEKAPEVGESSGEKKQAAEPAATAETTPLERVWNLRDQLQSRQLGRGYSPVDFAPHIWLRINDQIVHHDQLQRRGRDPATGDLDKIENDLKLLAGLMTANETSKDGRFQQNLLDVSARLVAEWNQFASAVPAGTIMNPDVAACRDIYFRCRYLLEWTRTPTFQNDSEFRQEFLELVAELKQIRPLAFDRSIQSTDLPMVSGSVAKLRVHEQQLFKLVSGIMNELNRNEKNRTASDVYMIEQVFNSLLDSPLVSYASPFGSLEAESGLDQPHVLSRKSLNDSYARLLAQNLQPVPLGDSKFQWATNLWMAPNQRNVNDAQNNLKIAKAYLELGSEASLPDANNGCQLPDRSQTSVQLWEEELASCLGVLRRSGTVLLKAQSEYARSIDNANPGSLQAWPLAVLLSQKTIHTMAQHRDTLFVALPPGIEKMVEPIVAEFDIGPGKTNSTKIDLDQPDSKRQFFFTTRGGDPRNIQLRLSVDEQEKDLASLLEFSSDETGLIELDKPFLFPLARGTSGEFLPFNLTIRSSPAAASQSRRQIGIKLRLVGSDDPRVSVRDDEYLPLTVQLPREDRVDMVVGSSSFTNYAVSAVTSVDSRSFYDRQNSLYALPNRFRNTDFRLENKSGRTKNFRLELFSVKRPDSFDNSSVLPGQILGRTIQNSDAIERMLDSVKKATIAEAPLAISKEFVLAPDESKLLDFRPEPVAPDDSSDPPGNGPSGQIATGAESLFDLNNGLYCRLSETDVNHGHQTTRDFWFDIKQLPSEELVKATATFDPLNKLLTIKLEPRWDADKPCPVPGGVECILEAGNSIDLLAKIRRRLAKLDDENRSGELQFEMSRDELVLYGPILLYVNINEYRGVFIYKLEATDFQGPARTLQNLRPNEHFLVLRRIITKTADSEPVTHWKTGSNWNLTPPEKMEFEIWADMDDGKSDDCRIHLDIKRDEWTQPEPQTPRLGDRKLDYRAKINDANGLLDLQVLISDHKFDWTPDNDVSGKCQLSGRVVFPQNQPNRIAGKTNFEESLRIDGLPPTADVTRWVIDGANQGKVAAIKENQQQVLLEVLSEDLDLAGTRSMKLFVDKDNDPVVSDADSEMDSAKLDGGNEQWRYRFDIATLLQEKILDFGDNEIYALLVDQLGNETDRSDPIGPLTLTINKLTDEEKAMIAEAKIKKYTLNVQLLRRDSTPNPKPLPAELRAKVIGSDGEEVHFQSKANQDGSYSLLNVPVGDYKLVCEYVHTTPTHVKKKMRKELPLQLTVQKAPGPVVLILEEVDEDP